MILIQDSFTGADGLLNGHAPDVHIDLSVWSSAAVAELGGCLISGNAVMGDGYYSPATLTDLGTANIPFDNIEMSIFTGQLSLTLGATVSGGTSYTALETEFVVYGAYWKIIVKYVAGTSTWLLVMHDNVAAEVTADITSSVSSAVTLTIDFSMEDGLQTVSIGGATATTYGAFINAWQGLEQVTLSVGGFAKLESMLVEDASPVSGAVLTAPAATILFSAFSDGSRIYCPSPTMRVVVMPGAGNLPIPIPAPAISATGGGMSELSAPAPTLIVYGGATSTPTAPAPTLYATAHDAFGERAAILTAPTPALSAYAGASAGLVAPSVALSATATCAISGSAELSAPVPTISSEGTVAATAGIALSAPLATLIGYGGAVCSITLTGSATIAATGITGSIGGAAITCPLFELTATGTAQAYGSANLIAPAAQMGSSSVAYLVAPTATLTAIGHAAVTATYEAYAVNLNHQPKPGKEPVDEVTRYTNFPFTHIVRYQNSYFGANSTGLYLLEGTTDYASPTPTAIPWAFKTAMTDFKSQQHKTVASAYFGGRLGAAATVSLHVGEDGPQTYSYATVRTDHAQNYRQVFGKGTKARYYALGASGTGTMELDDIDLDVHNLTRRI